MEKHKEIIIVDEDSDYRERCALALHHAFGVVASELPATVETVEATAWEKVRAVVTDYNARDARRLWLITYLRKYHPHVVIVGLNLEDHQLRLTL